MENEEIKDALQYLEIFFQEYPDEEIGVGFKKFVFGTIIKEAENLIQLRRFSQALKILNVCSYFQKNNAQIFYLRSLIFQLKKEINISVDEFKKASKLDPKIELQYIRQEEFFLNIRDTVIEISKVTNNLLKTSTCFIVDLIKGPGQLLRPIISVTRGPKRVKKEKVLLVINKEEIDITSNPKKSQIIVKGKNKDTSLVNSKGKKIIGKRKGNELVFNLK